MLRIAAQVREIQWRIVLRHELFTADVAISARVLSIEPKANLMSTMDSMSKQPGVVQPIDFRARRARLASEARGAAVVVLAQPVAYRNSTVEHSYRQDSLLYYLTGFVEPEAALVVLPHRPEGERIVLFMRERDPERETWDGRRLGIERAKEHLGVDQAFPFHTLWDKLPELLGGADGVYFNLGVDDVYDRAFIGALKAHRAKFGKRGLSAKLPVHDVTLLSGRLRLYKEPAEIERMRVAAVATHAGHARALERTRPGMNEREVHALLVGEFLAHGAEMEAYGAIVAGGINSCILHYRENDARLKDGDLLLIDAGAQFDYYACDVTRTFPVGQRFTPEQRAIYDVVLAAQKAAIAKAIPGSTLEDMHMTAIERLVEGLLDLKIMTGSKEMIIKDRLFTRYYMHGTSHWIGMDVHDAGLYFQDGRPLALAPGMYFSVEPGLYFDPADTAVPAAFRGIGIRIEDDVLITAGGNEVITAKIAKEPGELENRY